MEKKNLYILSSEHLAPNTSLADSLLRAGEVLAVRLQIVEALGQCFEEGSYFTDRLTDEKAAQAEELVELATEYYKKRLAKEGELSIDQFVYEELIMRNFELFLANPADLDLHREIGALTKLRIAGHKIEPKPTEGDEHFDIGKRDHIIYEKVKQHGSRENILFIGRSHPLMELMASSEFRVFRLEIWKQLNIIFLNGSLPVAVRASVKNAIAICQSQLNMNLMDLIDFR